MAQLTDTLNKMQIEAKKTTDLKSDHPSSTAPKAPQQPEELLVLSPPEKKQPVYKPSTIVIQPQMKVNIVHVKNFNTVFVVPCSEIENWQRTIEEANNYASEAEPLKKAPEIGFIILAKYEQRDEYGRCIVVKNHPSKPIARVEFLEHGAIKEIDFKDLKCLPEEFVNLPRLVNMVKLTETEVETNNAHEIVRFMTDLQESRAEFIVSDLEPIQIGATFAHFHAKLTDGSQVLNDLWMQFSMVKLVFQPEPNLYILNTDLIHIGHFFAIAVSNAVIFGMNDSRINEYIDSGIKYHPRLGGMCLVQDVDDYWYRAQALERIDENTFKVILIDYGKYIDANEEKIRQMEKNLFFPCITAVCHVDGPPAAAQDIRLLIRQYSQVNFENVVYENEIATCRLSNLM